ncbi:hypothetical protein [Clostridium massiliodielmoense]|uniref:hypothetical protein n=1 Tax=Clostridium massiliodielmoense TaxID=1776385 RepID=UPI0004D5B6B1|nr:hypothetical protein [Clostridium massiliodielmoense]KEH97870.1 hypothetical protein Z962_02065 [Clostridium botulinum C/D str. BKT12695]
MKKNLKGIMSGILVSLILMLQVSFCSTQYVYANTKNTNNIEEKQNNKYTNKEVSKDKKGFSKQRVGIGIGVLLVVLIIGRAITPKEAFEPLKKNNKK